MISNPIGQRTYCETGDYVLKRFDDLAVPVPPDSRLSRMVQTFRNADGSPRLKIEAGDPDCQTAIEAGRDLTQLAFIFDALPPPVLGQFLPELQKVVHDDVLPQNDRGNSDGRDSQFHLYVAAICHIAGFTDIRNAEPDVVCCLGSDELGIAAKRVKTPAKLGKRIAKGSRQIARSKLPGLIAVETSLAFNLDNDRILAPLPDDEFLARYRGYFKRFVDRKLEGFSRHIDPWWVCGIVFHDQQIRLVNNCWETAGMTFGVPLGARCTTHPEKYWAVYERGLPNRETSPLILPQRRLLLI